MGPTLGGVLVDKFGFDWAATGCAILIISSVSNFMQNSIGIYKTISGFFPFYIFYP